VPPSDVNVPGDYFSLAGFEVTTYGRFWVTPEASLISVREGRPKHATCFDRCQHATM
jgi:hypothetical protein